MSGREADVRKAWKLIKEVIQLEEPTPTGRYLGCQHQESMGDLAPHLSPSAELPGITPSKEAKHRVRVLTYDMSSFVEQCVSSYLELAGHDRESLRDVPTPFLDESTACEPPEGAPTGALAHVGLKVLMKILYVAHMARPDLLRATCMLARTLVQRMRPTTPSPR